jgi:hypothetical protein
MYIDVIPNRKSPPAVLLRECYRKDGKVRKHTVANLSALPGHIITALRSMLKGGTWVPYGEGFAIERSRPHGAVRAILAILKQSGLVEMLSAHRSRERDLVVALIAERLLHGESKLASIRLWQGTTLAQEVGVAEATPAEVYRAMDWLGGRQEAVEKKLARKHLKNGSLVLYDLTSSYYEGSHCPLAQHGYNRDGKRGLPIIAYGLITDSQGCPVAVRVWKGNVTDNATVMAQVERVREEFGIEHVTFVGDRGMLTETKIEALRVLPWVQWISALRSEGVRTLVEEGTVQPSLFDEQNLAEVTSGEFPGERLVVCYNPFMAEERRRKRGELMAETAVALDQIAAQVARRTRKPMGEAEIGMKIGRVANKWKMAKHVKTTIGNGRFSWEWDTERIAREQALDGLYVVRTNVPEKDMTAPDVVRIYKRLEMVERAFRSMKGMNNRVRPIYHRMPHRVCAHIFLCMLAYYVEWHLRDTLKEHLFEDEDLATWRDERDAVLPAQPTAAAKEKKIRGVQAPATVHSLGTLLTELGTLCRNECRMVVNGEAVRYTVDTEPTPWQSAVLDKIERGGCTQ